MNIHHHTPRRLAALLLVAAVMLSLVPSAFAAQEDNYHDPAEHWMEALNRTNELDANSVVTIETFNCCECGQATSFQVFRVPEYTRNGETALIRNVKYSDGTCLDGESKGDLLDGTPGKDAYYTGYSSSRRYFFAFFALAYTTSRSTAAPTIPTSQSKGWSPGAILAKAGDMVCPMPMSLWAKSAPAASR